jgi:hypothetical protein
MDEVQAACHPLYYRHLIIDPPKLWIGAAQTLGVAAELARVVSPSLANTVRGYAARVARYTHRGRPYEDPNHQKWSESASCGYSTIAARSRRLTRAQRRR